MEIKRQFGLALKRERERAKLTQEALANKIGEDDPYVDQAYISRVEAGQVNLTLETMAALAKALDVDPAVFLAKPPVAARRQQ